ncbi:YkvA family protein [Xanthomonadaceae bacterium XH05]|nr:YkvA family protein [Xanthomonadaceae bacterium XH05]
MPLSISFELSDQDIEHFVAAQRNATEAAGNKSAEEVIAAGAALLTDAQKTPVPDFIAQRLTKLDNLIAMVRDEGWHLPEEDRKRVLAALVYFADPSDVIPDSVPVLGYLDDAIMIELCVRDLKHEIDAYDDFCDYREAESRRLGLDPASVGRAEWLESRRDELINRMHSRRERDFGTGYGASSGYASKRSYAMASWRPSIFRTR